MLGLNNHLMQGAVVDLSKKWLSFIEEHVPNVILIVYDGRNGKYTSYIYFRKLTVD